MESITKTKRDRHVPVPEPVWKKLKAELFAEPNTLVFQPQPQGRVPATR